MGRSGVLFVVIICCIYVASLTETGRSGFRAGYVLPDSLDSGLLVYHCLLSMLFYVCFGGGGIC